jgi:aminoglycoside phosphotransferase family enzyme/predicted kinase
MPGPERREGESQRDLIAALTNPAVWGHAVSRVSVIETHLSFVLLTGAYAYKIKKAVDLSFADFRALDARRLDCEREVALNRRLARELYLGVVPITGTVARPECGGPGRPIEFAVKMREFAQDDLFSARLTAGRLAPDDLDALAEQVAAFHATAAPVSPASSLGTPATVWRLAAENFVTLRASVSDASETAALARLDAWTGHEFQTRAETMRRRRHAGFVRDCHGDLHLNNVTTVDGRVTVFDCLEFSDVMRCLDVMAEAAFTSMDLAARGRPDLAWRFLNRYLERTGDYPGASLLRFYLVYRAMVRAKVAALRGAQVSSADDRAVQDAERRRYLDLASGFVADRRAALVVMHGFSGAGKTVLAGRLVEAVGAIRLRTDVERKRLLGRAETARTASPIGGGAYTEDMTRQTYRKVLALSRVLLAAGHRVIVDGAFLSRWQRDWFRDLARQERVPFLVLSVQQDEATLRHRISSRSGTSADASEADLAVLDHQVRTTVAPGADEAADVVVVTGDESGEILAEMVRRAVPPPRAVA